MTNTALLKKTLAHIETHPHEWDQTRWIYQDVGCGTLACFAGWAVTLSGCKIDGDNEVRKSDLPPGIDDVQIDEGYESSSTGYVYVSVAARHLLGLDMEQGNRLFHGGNELDDLRRIVAELCADTAPATEQNRSKP